MFIYIIKHAHNGDLKFSKTFFCTIIDRCNGLIKIKSFVNNAEIWIREENVIFIRKYKLSSATEISNNKLKCITDKHGKKYFANKIERFENEIHITSLVNKKPIVINTNDIVNIKDYKLYRDTYKSRDGEINIDILPEFN